MNEGVHLARKGFAETMKWQKSFPPFATLMKSLIEDFDCKFYVCAELIKNAEVKSGMLLGELLMKRQGLIF